MLKFRNLDVDPSDPVEDWGFEGLLAAVERGDLRDWRRIGRAVRHDPRGKVAGELREVLAALENPAMANLFQDILDRAVAASDAADRTEVAEELSEAYRGSGLTRAEFAQRIGTSQSRLSTYLSGKVTPSSVVLLRARRLGRP